jgi:hypothetical protein
MKNEHSSHSKLTTTKFVQKVFCRQLYAEDPSLSGPKIFDRALAKLKIRMPNNLQNLYNEICSRAAIESFVSALRIHHLPQEPTTSSDYIFTDELKRFDATTDFLQIDSTDSTGSRILAFGHPDFFTHLSSCETMFVDGTYYTCPSNFKQLYTIHCHVDSQVVPALYCFLPDQKQTTYVRLLNSIKDLLESRGLPFAPKQANLDFELAMINALKQVTPSVRISGCNFHFGQCLIRNLSNHGMKSEYSSNSSLFNFVHDVIALQHLPVDRVRTFYAHTLLRNVDLFRTVDKFELFEQYLRETWIAEGARYPVEYWNNFNTANPRSNNHVEAFNGRLKRFLNNEKNPQL